MRQWRSSWMLALFGSALVMLGRGGLVHAQEGEESGSADPGAGLRDIVRGKGLQSTLQRVVKAYGADSSVAPILFVGSGEELNARDLAPAVFDFVEGSDSRTSPVAVAPLGDDEEGQAVAVVSLHESDDEVTSPRFASTAQEAGLAFAVASDVVYSVHYTDLLRGEARFVLLQSALEQYLRFQADGLLGGESGPKSLHVVVTGVEEGEADAMGLRAAVSERLAGLWDRVIKPKGKEEAQALAGVLAVSVVCLPNEEYAEDKARAALEGLRGAIEKKLVQQRPFVGARTLEGAVAALAPAGKQCVASASLPKDDAAISSYVLDKLVSRYAAQFKVDARRLQQEMEGAYDEEFGKTFNELLDKYLTDFTQEVYGVGNERAPNTALQGLDAAAVGTAVKRGKEQLRRALLSSVEESYRQQLQLLRRAVYEDFRKSIASFKYHWELVPGFTKAIKDARASFLSRAAKLHCRGAKWSSAAELRTLSSTMEEVANDVIERNRATGAFVPAKLRRPIGVQINWLGSNFFHFLRDSSCDPLSIRTDSGVALWQTVGEVYAQKKPGQKPFKMRDPYGDAIDDEVMNYLLVNPRGLGIGERDMRESFGWTKRLAYDLRRNLDDLTFQVPHAKGIATY